MLSESQSVADYADDADCPIPTHIVKLTIIYTWQCGKNARFSSAPAGGRIKGDLKVNVHLFSNFTISDVLSLLLIANRQLPIANLQSAKIRDLRRTRPNATCIQTTQPSVPNLIH